MLDPVIEEEEIGESEQRHGLEETNTGSKDSSESQQISIRGTSSRPTQLEASTHKPQEQPPSLSRDIHRRPSRSSRPYRHRLISRHNPRANLRHPTPSPPANDPPPSTTLTRRPSVAPPPDPKRLSEEALLHALHNIRIEEEEELSLRRKSLHIVEIPTTVLPLPPTDAPSAETEPESSSEEQTSEEGAPYDRFSVYQLACSRERLRDMEQQLQNAVCMMQDTVELVARRMREQAKANTAGEGKEEVTTVVRSMRAQLDRLAGAHERVSLEHGLVAREMGARPGNLWEEMARRMGAM
jgi:hypothetical protein